MDSFVILGFLVAVFLQLMPPQLCKEIQGFEGLYKSEDGLVDSRIETNVIAKQRVKRAARIDVDYSYPLIQYLLAKTHHFMIDESKAPSCVEHFCENIPNYPTEKINNAIKNVPIDAFYGIQGNFFNISVSESKENGTELCFEKRRIIFPQYSLDEQQKAVYIVNHGEKRQGVVMALCSESKRNKECGKGKRVDFPAVLKPQCSQKTFTFYFVAYDPATDLYGYHGFEIPSCCLCELVKV